MARRGVESQAVGVPHQNPEGFAPRDEFAGDSRTKITGSASQKKHVIIG